MVKRSLSDIRPSTRRLAALLSASGPAGDLTRTLKEVAPVLQERAAQENAVLRFGTRLEDDPFGPAAADTGRNVRSFDAVLQVEGAADQALETVLEGVNALIGNVLDAQASSIALGDVYVLTPGSGDTLLALTACRRSDISPAQMQAYWLRKHAALALQLMPDSAPQHFGYNQLHVDTAATLGAAIFAGLSPAVFDGLLQVWCNRPEDFLSVATEPAFAEQIFEDEKHFADQSRLQGAAFQTWRGVD